jgi:hypothetical protein
MNNIVINIQILAIIWKYIEVYLKYIEIHMKSSEINYQYIEKLLKTIELL